METVTVAGMGSTVTVALAESERSASLLAVITTEEPEGTVWAAVYRPDREIVPDAELPCMTPFASHSRSVVAGPVDVAVNCNELPAFMAAFCGEMETALADRCGGIGGDKLGDDKPPQPKTKRQRLGSIRRTTAFKSLTRDMVPFTSEGT